MHGFSFISTTVYIAIITLANLRVAMEYVSITVIHQVIFWITVLLLFPVLLAFNLLQGYGQELLGVITRMYSTGVFWLTLLIAVSTPLLIDYTWEAVSRTFFPSLVHVLREREHMTSQQRAKLPTLTLQDAAKSRDRATAALKCVSCGVLPAEEPLAAAAPSLGRPSSGFLPPAVHYAVPGASAEPGRTSAAGMAPSAPAALASSPRLDVLMEYLLRQHGAPGSFMVQNPASQRVLREDRVIAPAAAASSKAGAKGRQ